ncbi:cytochrome P450 [Jimgerdemannia flammicorona]|uniref:Cytochrome P450 n=1 Tax=Jimgerdemannia flammicorona TaxID=994334 RepID=A0A433DGN7_9FUNG|nr:cytochrome P450 [Jimgerdemannia flammicorona]
MSDLTNILANIDHTTLFTTVVAVAGVAVAIQLFARSNTKALLPLPPSPSGKLPALGHLLAIGMSPHLTFTRWAKTLGPIFCVQMGAKTWIILNSPKVIRDIIDLRGGNYSDRGSNVIIKALSRNGEMYAFSEYGDYLRMCRKLTNNTLSKNKVQTLHKPIFDNESRNLLTLLLRDGRRPEGARADDLIFLYTVSFALIEQMVIVFRVAFLVFYRQEFQFCILIPFMPFTIQQANVIMMLLYAKRWDSPTDPFYQEVRSINNAFTAFFQDLVLDFFPILTPLFAGKIAKAKTVQDRIIAYTGPLVEEVRQKLKNGEKVPCITAEFVEAQRVENFSDMGIIQTTGGFTLAGIESTMSALLNSIIVLANHPEIQQRFFDELYNVVGPDRLPEEADVLNTPYVEAFILEVLRFRPATFFGVPHAGVNEDEYEGYRIPAGALVVMNLHALHFDETTFPNAEIFDPTRWLTEDGLCDSKMQHWAFGGGRRVCPGQFMAETSIRTTLSRLVWAFRIEFPLDSQGNPVPVPIPAPTRIDCMPAPFNMRFIPRRENVARVVSL